MTLFSVLWLFFYFSLAAATICLAGSSGRLRWFTKAGALPFLAFFSLSLPGPGDVWVLAALGFGLAGDVLLLFQKKKRFFIAGLGAFLLGHLCYAVRFYGSLGPGALFQPLTLGYLLAAAGLGFAIQRRLTRLARIIRIPTVVYMGVISAMGLGALLRWGWYAGWAFWAPLAGAVLFMLSDTMIAFRNFRGSRPALHRWVSVTYYGAQLLIVAGLATSLRG